MYIAFSGLSFSGKGFFPQIVTQYLISKKIQLNDIEIITDPKSTTLGSLIVSISREKYQPNITVEGNLYLVASCDVYDHLIQPALLANKHIITRGYFTEILVYQGNSFNKGTGFDWKTLKDFYQKNIAMAHNTNAQYPDLLFICINSYEKSQAQLKSQALMYHSYETNLSKEQIEEYNQAFINAHKTINEDQDFTRHTKVILVDSSSYASLIDTWEAIVKPEIDSLLQGVVLE